MVMQGKFKIADVYEKWPHEELLEFLVNPKERPSYYVEVKFKNAKIIRTTSAGFCEFKEPTICYNFIARDNATLKRLQKFVQSDTFDDILYGRLGNEGMFVVNL